MLGAKTTLPIDALPIAPYDDGFSTESEDGDLQEGASRPPSPKLRDSVDIPPKTAVLIENQSQKHQEVGATIDTEIRGQEEGEVIEEVTCKRCRCYTMPLAKRLKIMNEAAQAHGGKRPPPSRQCACCRITYPSAALTNKSRKLTRAVPICITCSRAGGSTIYENLAVSDEFIVAFKIENPSLAKELLSRKESIVERGNKLRECTKHPKAPIVFGNISKQYARRMGGRPPVASSQPDPYGKVMMGNAPQKKIITYRRVKMMAGKSLYSLPKDTNEENKLTNDQPGRHPPAQSSLTSRWLKQFELVDGKTARERRLEKRNAVKEHNLEKKKQRTG